MASGTMRWTLPMPSAYGMCRLNYFRLPDANTGTKTVIQRIFALI